MTEEEIKLEKEIIINIIDGVACIYLKPGIIGKKLPPPVVIPFHFSTMQKQRERDTMPDIIKEFKRLFEDNRFSISYFELPGPKKKEDKKDDNQERERKTKESI